MRLSRLGLSILPMTIMAAISSPTALANTVKVQPGQSLWKIARWNGISLQSLEAANPNLTPTNLLVGTVVNVPGGKSTVQPASTTTVSSNTSQNLYWMERVINAEAGGQSLQAQIAVGDVIMHRLKAGQYGSTVHDVVFQISNGHYQFTSVANGYIYTAPNASSIQAATDVLDRGQDVVPGALVFYNPAMTPASSWVWSQPTISKIDNLVFAK